MEKVRGGIKTEAVGRYFATGEEIMEAAIDIENEANHFSILYEYDFDVDKMVSLANSIKEKAERLALLTKYIADNIKRDGEGK